MTEYFQKCAHIRNPLVCKDESLYVLIFQDNDLISLKLNRSTLNSINDLNCNNQVKWYEGGEICTKQIWIFIHETDTCNISSLVDTSKEC